MKCSVDGCDQYPTYDGREHGIFHLDSFCIHYSVLRDYMHHLLLGNGYDRKFKILIIQVDLSSVVNT